MKNISFTRYLAYGEDEDFYIENEVYDRIDVYNEEAFYSSMCSFDAIGQLKLDGEDYYYLLHCDYDVGVTFDEAFVIGSDTYVEGDKFDYSYDLYETVEELKRELLKLGDEELDVEDLLNTLVK